MGRVILGLHVFTFMLTLNAGSDSMANKRRMLGRERMRTPADSRRVASTSNGELLDTLPHIKRVSRIKHAILHRYLPAWARILGSENPRLCYFDCYAGRGQYEFQGQAVKGSALVAVSDAKEYVSEKSGRLMAVVLMEKNAKEAEALQTSLGRFQPYPKGLEVHVLAADSRRLVKDMLSQIDELAPSFFMIDPYGHPLSIPLIKAILARQRTEALITLMWYRINMDLGNPAVQHLVDNLFGDGSWRGQPFVNETGNTREEHFLDFFSSRLGGKFVLPFRIGFDPEDAVRGHRTKYYLLHASNHPKAALLMKEVMWPLGDEDGTFDFSGEAQGVLISKTPKEEELEQILLQELSGERLAFDEIRERTWNLPFIERHYRSVLKGLEGRGNVSVKRITSKETGLSGRDLITFR